MKKICLLIVVCFLFSSCASIEQRQASAERRQARKQARIKKYTDTQIHRKLSYRSYSGARPLYRQELINRHPEWPEKIKEYIKAGVVLIGMTEEQLLAIRGNPNDINRIVGSWGVNEQWVYGPPENYSTTYFYLKNDKVTSWQD